MTIKEIIEARQIIQKWENEELDFKKAYAIMTFLKETQDDFDFVVKKEQELLNEYGLKDENGELKRDSENPNMVFLSDPSTYSTKMNELLDIESSKQITQLTRNFFDGFRVSAKELQILSSFIKEQ